MQPKTFDVKELIREIYNFYLIRGTRSNYKIKILHTFLSNYLRENLSSEYKVYSLNIYKSLSEEFIFKNGIFKKNIDIAITKNSKLITAIETKTIFVHYSKNSNNYIENMIGQIVNLNSDNVKLHNLYIIKNKPYFTKNCETIGFDNFDYNILIKKLLKIPNNINFDYNILVFDRINDYFQNHKNFIKNKEEIILIKNSLKDYLDKIIKEVLIEEEF